MQSRGLDINSYLGLIVQVNNVASLKGFVSRPKAVNRHIVFIAMVVNQILS